MPNSSPLTRQWKLLSAMGGSPEGISVQELARTYSVNDKTIRRDLILLRGVGFPLEETLGDHGRKLWRLAAARVPPMALNWEEAMALYLARRFLEPLSSTQFGHAADRAFAKIRSSLGQRALQYLERMASAIHLAGMAASDYASKAALLDALTLAIEECRVALLTYQSERSTEPVTREIHPYAWVFHRNWPYLVAYATEHEEVRLYKADRMHNVEVTEMRFPRPNDFDVAEYFSGSFGVFRGQGGAAQTIQVRFSAAVAQYVSEKQWHPSQQLNRQADGSLRATFALSSTEEFTRWVLSFGKHAQILEPKSLRAALAAELRQMVESYSARAHSGGVKNRGRI
jgi:proteasome accessory factor B